MTTKPQPCEVCGAPDDPDDHSCSAVLTDRLTTTEKALEEARRERDEERNHCNEHRAELASLRPKLAASEAGAAALREAVEIARGGVGASDGLSRSDEKQIEDALASNAGSALLVEVERYRAALNKIAVWDDGPKVTNEFDEPGSASIAREALGKK